MSEWPVKIATKIYIQLTNRMDNYTTKSYTPFTPKLRHFFRLFFYFIETTEPDFFYLKCSTLKMQVSKYLNLFMVVIQ